MLRKAVVRVLYATGEACFLVADQLSPATDQVWRDRRWKQFLRNESRLDAYEIPAEQWSAQECAACGVDHGDEACEPWRTREDDGD